MTSLPKVSLAMRPTPLARMARASVQLGVDLWVKRDDLTGSVLTGSKVRKLEYLLADAQAQSADVVLTCGGDQSNHCRATAIAARQLGIDSVLFLRVVNPTSPPPTTANLLLDRVVGAEVRFISRGDYTRRREVMHAAADELRAAGRRPYLIPEGGSNALGSLGYVDCVGEIAEQIGPGPLTVVYAAGSGGTGAGLIAGVRARDLPWRVVGINVCDDRSYFVGAIGVIVEEMIAQHGWSFSFSRESIEIVDGFVGRGYAQSRPEELRALIALARSEGLVLDPVYTGKAWYGLTETLARDPRALGERIVFLHSGGVFGLFPKTEELTPLL
jgi:D-cysteine desulfhydrase